MKAEDRYDSLILWYAAEHGRDPKQIKRQIRRESAFNPNARSSAGAEGLAQFMQKSWAEWYDAKVGIDGASAQAITTYKPNNPEWAIRSMCAFMEWLEKRHGTLAEALAAYNWGTGNLGKLILTHGDNWRLFLPQETRDYLAYCLIFMGEHIG